MGSSPMGSTLKFVVHEGARVFVYTTNLLFNCKL